jgi:hypothetical protein
MHTDEEKRFDKRNIPRNLKEGVVTQKEYEVYLSKLPDLSESILDAEEVPDSDAHGETESKKRKSKKGKGK